MISTIPQLPDLLMAHVGGPTQNHLRQWWSELNHSQREQLQSQIEQIDFAQIDHLFKEATAGHQQKEKIDPASIKPPYVHRLTDSSQDHARTRKGEEALRNGQVGVVLVAGGQGTRLGFDGPKGTYPIGPITDRTLFQIHAEKVLALSRRYQTTIPLLIMTSSVNDQATRDFFEAHDHFGLDSSSVTFFQQGTMPAVNRETGRILMSDRDQLALSPNGHGGTLQALADQGHLARCRKEGIEYLFYLQVDNPMVKIADPLYLGMHLDSQAEMSIKVVPKISPEEKMGVVVQIDNQVQMIEYVDLPEDVAQRRTPEGRLEIDAGNIAVHVFNVSFLERLAEGGTVLPFHFAHKIVPHLDHKGEMVKPDRPNAIKFETFIFDAIPLAEKVMVVETDRAEEFEPLKNASGTNCPATVRQALSDLYGSWLRDVGVSVPSQEDGSTSIPIEISPSFALNAQTLRERLASAEVSVSDNGILLTEPEN